MDSGLQKLQNDIELIRGAIVRPFYWLIIGLGLFMILPKLSTDFPDIGVTYWHVFAAIIVSCVAQFAANSWVSRRFDRTMKQNYPELFTNHQTENNSADI